jgi:hypothetical protein
MRLVTGLSPWRPGFDPSFVHVRFAVDKVTLRFSPVSIIPPMLHTHLLLHIYIKRRTKERKLETFHKAVFFRNQGAWYRKYLHLVLVFKRLIYHLRLFHAVVSTTDCQR